MAIKSGETTYHQAKRGIVQNGLVLNLDAGVNESYSGGTTWRDLEGSNNGTLTNSPAFDRDKGGSFSFDGSNESIQGGDTYTNSVNGHHSACVWYKATGVPSNNDTAGAILFAQSNNFDHGIVIYNSWAYQRIGYGSRINDGFYVDSIANNEVYFVVAQWDGSTQKIWVDGELKASRSYTLTPYAVNPAYQVGRWGHSIYTRHLNGNMYSVQLYNRALTATEITQNYNVTRHRFGV